jgi:hypothetical protein
MKRPDIADLPSVWLHVRAENRSNRERQSQVKATAITGSCGGAPDPRARASALDGSQPTAKHGRMASTSADRPASLRTAPLTPERWADLETVFGGGRGDCGRCWCMYWRLPRRDFEASLGDRKSVV